MKNFRIFNVYQSLFIVICIAFVMSGCAAIDRMISSSKSPDSTSQPKSNSSTAPNTDNNSNDVNDSASLSKSNSSTAQNTDNKSSDVNDSASPSKSNSSTAQNTENSSSDRQLDRLVKTRECLPPNQAEYVYGNYKIGWTIGGFTYEGLLQMKGRIGKMQVQYFNPETNKTDAVDQTMVLASCTKGLAMLGFNPVITNTDRKHPTYSADNLIFRRETDGTVNMVNYDDQGVKVPVEIEQVSNVSN